MLGGDSRQVLAVLGVVVVGVVVLLVPGTDGFACKFPNEGCRVNKECCSGKCVDAHPGTNPRCTRLSLHDRCLYTYQCDDRLRCGTNNTCCSKYWGTCTKKADCCDPQHSCYEVDGFYYKRCLYAKSGSARMSQWCWSPLITRSARFVLGEGGCVVGWLCSAIRSLALSVVMLAVVGVFCALTTGSGVMMMGMETTILNGGGDVLRGCGKSGCGGKTSSRDGFSKSNDVVMSVAAVSLEEGCEMLKDLNHSIKLNRK